VTYGNAGSVPVLGTEIDASWLVNSCANLESITDEQYVSTTVKLFHKHLLATLPQKTCSVSARVKGLAAKRKERVRIPIGKALCLVGIIVNATQSVLLNPNQFGPAERLINFSGDYIGAGNLLPRRMLAPLIKSIDVSTAFEYCYFRSLNIIDIAGTMRQ